MKSADNIQPRSLWPIALTAFFSLVVLFSIGFVVFCTMQSSELVAPDYYEKEVRYGDEMARVQRANALSAEVSMSYDPARRILAIKIPQGHVRSGLKGNVELYRASSAGMDRVFPLATDSEGRQLVSLAELASGPWDVKLCWHAEGLDYQLEQRLILQNPGAS